MISSIKALHKRWITALFLLTSQLLYSQQSYPVDIKLIDIPAGFFYMGSEGVGINYDEAPIHKVTLTSPFKMSATEITNAQYEAFDPSHKFFRGKNGLSLLDDEAVVFVSYYDAVNYCKWLSKKEGKIYRLPTEAEWEYACRAGSYLTFSMDDGLPGVFQKNQQTARDLKQVSLLVGQTPANAFGLYDMHGNVEEWCLDWYGPYSAKDQTDPVGMNDGSFRVTRGGSHNTPEKFLRSANRQAMIPDDKHSQTGFRVVLAEFPSTAPLESSEYTIVDNSISQKKEIWEKRSNKKPLFMAPVPFVIKPSCNSGTPFYKHNHQPAITWCSNGDLLAIWFSAEEENGRDMVVLSSRLRNGQSEWDEASLFFKVPDRNMTGSAIFNDGQGKLFHINGMEASGDWQNLAMVKRESTDNGASWSKPEIIAPEHTKRHQVIAGTIKTREGWFIQACDAGPGSHDGAAIHISKDHGKTWLDPWDGKPSEFKQNGNGSTIAGIHTGIVQLMNGDLMALARGNSIPDSTGLLRMPMSISKDMGKNWTYSASEFPPLDGGQRLVFLRLQEGPLLLISFTDHPIRTKKEDRGLLFTNASGKSVRGYGMYAALSFDEGKTWPIKKLITDGTYRFLNGGAWTGAFEMDATHAEPRGYLAATQSPDNVIHLVSSRLHYRFNLTWLLEPAK